MKFNSKLCTLAAVLALGIGGLVGCNKSGGGSPAKDKYLVTVPSSTDYSIAGINEDRMYEEGATVSFTVTLLNDEKLISEVGYLEGSVRNTLEESATGYEFAMPASNVSLYVALDDVPVYTLTHTGTLQVDGDPVVFSLSLDEDPVPNFDLSATAGSDLVTISGHSVTALAKGTVTLAASIDSEVVATETVEIARSANYTIREAIDDAWANTADFNDNTKSTKTTSKYKITAKVVFMGSVYSNKVEMLLDDGTGIIDYQIKSSTDITAFTVGDVIQIEEPLQNYYGLMEMYSSDVKYATKLDGVEIVTTSFTDIADGAAYDSVYNANMVNDGEHKIVPVNLVAAAKTVSEKKRYEVPDATKGLLATTKSVIELKHEEGVKYDFHGYLLNWNASAEYCNFIALEQSALKATAISIDQDAQELPINNTLQLSFTATPAGAGAEIAWSSSDEAVATVDENGLVTAVAAGTATITLTVDGLTDTVVITVPAELNPATAAEFSKAEQDLTAGDTFDLNELLTVTPADTTDAGAWTSSNEAVATVSESGVVTAVAKGNAVISVVFNESVNASININVAAIHGTDISDPLTVDEAYEIGMSLAGSSGKSVYSDLTYYMEGVIDGNLTINESTVKADPAFQGKVGLYNTGLAESVDAASIERGSKVIVCGQVCNYSNGYKIQFSSQASIVSADNTEATFIEIEGENSVAVGETITLTANVYPASLSLSATFSSDNESVAAVTLAGVVAGVAAGTATITATYGEISETHTVSVISATAQTVTKAMSEIASENSWTTSAGSDVVCYTSFDLGQATVSTEGEPNCGSYWGAGDWRLYQNKGGNLVITAKEGYTLVSVIVTYNVSNNGTLLNGETVVSSGDLVSIGADTITLTVGNTGDKTNGQVRVTNISLSYDVK